MALSKPTFKPTLWSKENVFVPLSIVISVGLSAVTITSVVMNKLNDITNEIRAVRRMSEQCWTRPQMRELHGQLWRDNPTLNWERSQPDVIADRVQ